MSDNNEKQNNSPAEPPSSPPPKKGKGIFGRLKKIKHIELILAGVAVLVMLIIFFSSGASCASAGFGSSPNAPPSNESRQQRIQRELSESFSKIDGAGETIVIINWESSMEASANRITNQNQNSNQLYPRALGVLILTQGGDNVRLKLELINAVSVFLDITPDRIRILSLAT